MVALIHEELNGRIFSAHQSVAEIQRYDKQSLPPIVGLSIAFHICQWVWLFCCDYVEVESARLVQYVDVALGERRRYIPGQVLVLEVKVELGASVAEDCPEEDDEE